MKMKPNQVELVYGIAPYRTHYLGTTSASQKEFEHYLLSVQSNFTRECYDLVKWNCNNFTEHAARFLIKRGIPAYILELPEEITNTFMGKIIINFIKVFSDGPAISSEAANHPKQTLMAPQPCFSNRSGRRNSCPDRAMEKEPGRIILGLSFVDGKRTIGCLQMHDAASKIQCSSLGKKLPVCIAETTRGRRLLSSQSFRPAESYQNLRDTFETHSRSTPVPTQHSVDSHAYIQRLPRENKTDKIAERFLRRSSVPTALTFSSASYSPAQSPPDKPFTSVSSNQCGTLLSLKLNILDRSSLFCRSSVL